MQARLAEVWRKWLCRFQRNHAPTVRPSLVAICRFKGHTDVQMALGVVCHYEARMPRFNAPLFPGYPSLIQGQELPCPPLVQRPPHVSSQPLGQP